MLLALAVGLVTHFGFAVAVYCSPVPDPDEWDEPERVEVMTFDKDIRLKKPDIQKRQPVPEPVEIPKLELEPLPELERLEPDAKPKETQKKIEPAPKRTPRTRKRRPRKSKQKSKPKPKTVVISTAIKGTGGPRVHGGDEDVFGNPEVEHTPESSRPDDGPRGDAPPDRKGTGPVGPITPAAKPKIVPPRVRKKVKGVYPDDAPRTGRPIVITLSLRIDDKGRVKGAKIKMKPSNAGTFFDKEAKRVVRKMRFDPATKDGKPIPFTIRHTVVFTP